MHTPAVGTDGERDVVLRPAPERIGTAERRPDDPGLSVHFRGGDAVGCREGEAPPDRPAGLAATAAGGPSGGHD